jgi:anti-anti-sigma factor
MPAVGASRLYRPEPSWMEKPETCHRARFAARRLSSSRVLVAVEGEIDATNGRSLGRYVERNTGASMQLVLDLSGVNFFGTQGFAALHYISVSCARNDTDWMIVGGRDVRRLVRICDPDEILPLADRLQSALARLDRIAGRHNPVRWPAEAKPARRTSRNSTDRSNERTSS